MFLHDIVSDLTVEQVQKQAKQTIKENDDDLFADSSRMTDQRLLVLVTMWAKANREDQLELEELINDEYGFAISRLEGPYATAGGRHDIELFDDGTGAVLYFTDRNGIVEPSRNPAGDLNENDDDLFAPPGRYSKWMQAVRSLLNELYSKEYDRYQEQGPEYASRTTIQSMSDYDYLLSELGRGGIPAFLNGLDAVNHNVIDTIDAIMAVRYKIYLSDMEAMFGPESLAENDDDLFDPKMSTDPWLDHYIGKPIIGTARIIPDLQDAWHHDPEDLSVEDRKFYNMAGRTVSVLDWSQRTNFAVIYLGAFHPFRVKTWMLDNEDIDWDLRDALYENDDDLFAPSNRLTNPILMARGIVQVADDFDDRADRASTWADAESYRDYASILRFAARACSSGGARACMKELLTIEDPDTWAYLEHTLAQDFDIDLSDLYDRYENDNLYESDDDLFAEPTDASDIAEALEWLAKHWRQRAENHADRSWSKAADQLMYAASLFRRGGMMPGIMALNKIDRWEAIGDDLEYWHEDEWQRLEQYLDNINENAMHDIVHENQSTKYSE